MSPLDKAILAYRAEPTEANRQRILELQNAHNQNVMQGHAEEYIRRTR